MKNRKNIILMLFGLIFQPTYTQKVDEQGKTKLIKYIEQRDTDLVDLQNEVSKLWDDAIYTTVQVSHGYNSTTTTTTYRFRPFCTADMLKKIYEGRKSLKNFKKDTQNEIAQIIKQGVSINESDNQGKTALNYAKFRQTYNVLRNQGADFQIEPFVAMYQHQVMAAAGVATAWAAAAIIYLLDDVHSKKDPINIRDEMGRTPLMNYILQEENRIDLLGERNYFIFLVDAKAKIKRMIEQGARLDIKDFEGKTVMDYCHTVEIYNYLNSFNVPSYFSKWLEDNNFGIFCLGAASVVALSVFAMALSDSVSIPGINEIDSYVEKNILNVRF